MLTSLLTTFVLGAMLQDAAPAAATTTSDPEARALMESFESKLHDPVAEGLKSLAFDIKIPNPMTGGSMGTVGVAWTADDGSEVSFEFADDVKAMIPAAQQSMFKAPMDDMGNQLIGIQTNRMMSKILADYTVKHEGNEEGFVKVVATPRPDIDTIREQQVMFFDEAGVLAKVHEKVSQMGRTMDQDQTMNWAAVEGSDKLVLESTESKGMAGTQNTRFVREKLGGFLLVTKMELSTGGKQQVVQMENFVVNGKPAGGESIEVEGEG